MRTTVNLDDELLSQAREMTSITSNTKLLREALKALVQRESARRLAKLKGSEPGLRPIPRRRFDYGSD
ncbi:MAG: type II toxin-antitoxin system VapB family antitoxin [Candidatus Dadabacteria bacterium]|nr:type II toxin-antitoxin system VapB family antitoxin [Candidatus Dadabacteria bacterium]MCY3826971.1 type II toxin-antitoxin system VapB family antitoxin [Candidatus Dadabacteria bacterium]MDE0663612.1 type II toxin-antitoxin system VapB family antitoxin [Candidatus Dadabacteria bacterium]